MKKTLYLVILATVFTNCSNDGFNNNNPYIPNYSFSINIDLNLPSYSALAFPSNSVFIGQAGAGVKGIILFKAGNDFNAFEAACPNQPISSCSTLSINGINAVCPCDNESYNLFTGLSTLQYPLKRYRVEVNGNILKIYN